MPRSRWRCIRWRCWCANFRVAGKAREPDPEALRAMECLEILDYHIGFEERKTRKARKTLKQTLDEVSADMVVNDLEQEQEELGRAGEGG